jgi:hypothetical protein
LPRPSRVLDHGLRPRDDTRDVRIDARLAGSARRSPFFPALLPLGVLLALPVLASTLFLALLEGGVRSHGRRPPLPAPLARRHHRPGGFFGLGIASNSATSFFAASFLGFAHGQKGGAILRVPWPALMEIAGECLVQEPYLDPPRWRTKGWPEEGALGKLRAAAVS